MSSEIFAIVDGTVIDGTGKEPIPESVVVIQGAHIMAVGPKKLVQPPLNARIVEASGYSVLPGLIDLHQHSLHEWDKGLFPKAGITSVRFAGGRQTLILKLRERIRQGGLVGPRIFSVGPTIDCPPTARPDSALVVRSLEEASLEAEELIRHGHVDALFAARRINSDFLRVILDVAHSHGKPVTGQVYEISAREAAQIGIDGLENTSRIPESPDIDDSALRSYRSVSHRIGMLGRLWATAPDGVMREILGIMAEHRVEWAPGVVSFEHWAGLLGGTIEADGEFESAPPDLKQAFRQMQAEISCEWSSDTLKDWRRGIERIKYWVGYYHKIGGPIVTGTDTAFGAITYHRELNHLREAGLTQMDVIVAATSRSARALRQPYLGAVAVGKLADIIVVEGDPLKDLDTLRRPIHVFVGGRPEVLHGRVRDPAKI